jgi:hypothetical protein
MFNQRAIDFPPLGNPWILGLASAEVLRGDQIDEVERLLDGGGPLFGDELPEPLMVWCHAIAQANSEYFRFQLDGVLELGEPSARSLEVGEALDDAGLRPDHSTRKLVSLLVLAVTGEQVGFRLEETQSVVPAVRGSFVTFPAYGHVGCVGQSGGVRFLLAHGIGPAFT